MGKNFAIWVSLALLAGAILVAYKFFVWRYRRTAAQAIDHDDKNEETPLLGQ